MSVFGVSLAICGHGHVVTTPLLAMGGMLLTAISYGRMARAYPSAGSAFTYVGQEINPALGYVTGWSMVMDYILNPLICIRWCSEQASNFAARGAPPDVGHRDLFLHRPEPARCQDFGASQCALLATGMGLVVLASLHVAVARYIFGNPHDGFAFFTRPLL